MSQWKCQSTQPTRSATAQTTISNTGSPQSTSAPTTLQRNIIKNLEAARKTNYGRFIIFHSAGNEITTLLKLYIRWLEFWRTPGANSLIMCPNTQEAKAMRQELKDIAKYTPAELNLPAKALKYSAPTLIYCRKLAKYTHIRTHYSKRSYHTGIPYHYALITDASKCSYADDYKRAEEPSHLEVACRLIPSTIGGLFIIESGNRSIKNKKKYFYELWDHAKNNRVSYTPLFHCWHESNANVLPITGSYTDFIFSMDDYEWHLWRDQKLTLEQINWYRNLGPNRSRARPILLQRLRGSPTMAPRQFRAHKHPNPIRRAERRTRRSPERHPPHRPKRRMERIQVEPIPRRRVL